MRFFTSDQHYDHFNIIRYSGRPFRDVDEMREEMIRLHNEAVRPEDEVLHLGDFSMSEKAVPLVLPRLNGIHRLVVGNHDKCFAPKDRDRRVRGRYYRHGFRFVDERLDLEVGGFKVAVAHFPLRGGDETDLRHAEHRLRAEDLRGATALLHGHVHEKWRVRAFRGVPMVNVGVDVWDYAPVSEERLAETISSALNERG